MNYYIKYIILFAEMSRLFKFSRFAITGSVRDVVARTVWQLINRGCIFLLKNS